MIPFSKVVIWGLGLMGGSLAAALKSRGYTGTVIGISGRDALDQATAAGWVDTGFRHEDYPRAFEGADLVVLAAPIQGIMDCLAKLGPHIESGTIVTDMGSTKVAVSEAAAALLPEPDRFVGGHPMAGAEARGIQAADSRLYEQAAWVLTPPEGGPKRPVSALTAMIEEVGARAIVTDPITHDRVAARISHLPQTLAITLMSLAGQWSEQDDLTLRLAAGGFRDMTRIAASPYEVWGDIYRTNRQEILKALDDFLQALLTVRTRLERGELEEVFERANRFSREGSHS
jgi:prephenate dehydrogenase